MRGCYIITYHGTVVSFREADGAILHAPIKSEATDVRPIECTLAGGQSLAVRPAAQGYVSGSEYLITPSPRPGIVHLRGNSGYLRASPNGHLDSDAHALYEWEQYVIISHAQFELLTFLLSNTWVSAQTKHRYGPADLALMANFQLKLGDALLEIGHHLPFTSAPGQIPIHRSIMVYRDGWKVEELVLVRPLIYFCAFGATRYIKMVAACLKSFDLFNEISADVLIFTDLPETSVRNHFPQQAQARLHVQTAPSANFMDYYLQRFRIDEWAPSRNYQPLLYLDTDMLFTSDMTDYLADLALGSRLDAASEDFSPLLTSPSVGSDYVTADPFNLPYDYGFNAGGIGIPNLHAHRPYLRAILDVVDRYAVAYGASARHFMDQASANYVAAKLCPFSDRLTQRMELWFDGHQASQHLGLIHFWSAPDKLASMQLCLEALQGEVQSSGHPDAPLSLEENCDRLLLDAPAMPS